VSGELDLLDSTLRSLFDRHCTREARAEAALGDDVPRQLWTVLESSGMTVLGEEAGLQELVVLARAVGRAAAPVPLVEMAGLASWLAAEAGLALPRGIATAAASQGTDDLRLTRTTAGWRVDGTLHRVPWGRVAATTIALVSGEEGPLAVALGAPTAVRRGRNLAREPRDTLVYRDVALPPASVAAVDVDADALLQRGALLRSAAMAGAMDRVLDMTLDHAQTREQFGKPISTFQAVQAHLVAIAEESVCADMAVRAAAVAQDAFSVAAAKVTASAAADVVTARAHQVHGAIGTTQEHPLHWYSTRLWSWQDEFGNATLWAGRLGHEVVDGGAESLWHRLSRSLPDAAVTAAASTT
jgi:acyl-CoA dehydrogenase